MLRLLSIVIIYIVSLPLFAQKPEISLWGTVYDRQFREPLPGAHVMLLDSLDHTLRSVVTKTDGTYSLAGVPAGNFRIKVTYMGFQPQFFRINLKERQGKVRVADIFMSEESRYLQETVVTAQVPEITVSEDTVTYHAGSYSVTEGAMVEELLKKLPGVEIDEYGKITVNGKEVSQILVDGKDFFGNSTQTTLENLPADIIEKIKVYDKQSDQARITGVDDGNEKTVIDLSVKKDRKKGWFGQASAGAGTRQRYQGKFNINRFTEERKITLLGNAGNRNNGGQTEQQTAGMNYTLSKKTLEASGNVRLSHRSSDQYREIFSESFENERAPFSQRIQNSGNGNWNVNTDQKIEWRPDTLTTLLFKPSFRFSRQTGNSFSESASFSGDPFAFPGISHPLDQLDLLADSLGVNHNLNQSHNTGDTWGGNLTIQFNRRLRKPGRNVGATISGDINKNGSDRDNYSQIDYYQLLAADGGDSVYRKIQFYGQDVFRYNWNASLSYSELLSKKVNLQASYRFNLSRQTNERDAYSLQGEEISASGFTGENYAGARPFARRDSAQCQSTTNQYIHQDLRLQVRVNASKYFLTAGFSLQPQYSVTDYSKGSQEYHIGRSVFNYAPTANFRYRFSKQEQLKFTYQGSSKQPDILSLIPDTLDNANPLNIRLGNSGLKPSFTHRMNLSYNKYQREHQRSYAVNLNYQVTQNGIAQRVEYNELTGGRITRPENINGNWNASARFNMNTALANPRFRINSNTSMNYSHILGYVYKNKKTQTNKTRSAVLQEQLRGSYRNDWLDCGLSGTVRYNLSRNTMGTNQRNVYQFICGLDLQVKLPWGMKITTDLKENSRRGYSDDAMNTDEWVWNMQIAQSFLKRKAATISLQCYDILNQNSDITRQITSSGLRDVKTERISRYFMLHFIYRINRFGGKASARK